MNIMKNRYLAERDYRRNRRDYARRDMREMREGRDYNYMDMKDMRNMRDNAYRKEPVGNAGVYHISGETYELRDPETRHDYRRDYTDMKRDYNYNYDTYSKFDYSYDYNSGEMEYKDDIRRWIQKLKKKDKFNLTEEQVIQHARSIGVRFDDFTEEEFYATYLAMVSDYRNISTEPKKYIEMAMNFLNDDDIEVTPSEKLCIYYYKIVKGE